MVVIGALALSVGCGGAQSDADQARDVVETFMKGVGEQDAGLICKAVPPMETGGESCEEAGARNLAGSESLGQDFLDEIGNARADSVKIDGDEATVTTTMVSGVSFTVVKVDGSWYVDPARVITG